MHLQTILICCLLSYVCGEDRVIDSVLNPGCNTCTNKTTLLYTTAKGDQNTIHQIWDFSRGAPTIIFVVLKYNTTVRIKWEDNIPVKFTLFETPQYSFAMTMNKLEEYNDVENNGYIENLDPQKAIPLTRMTWERVDSVVGPHKKRAMLHMHGYFGKNTYHHKRQNGTVDVKFDLLPFKDYAVDLPHLIHTANSTLVDVELVNMTSSEEYNASRFAVHLTLVSTDLWSESMDHVVRKSLDDEHTPGVFEIFEIKTPRSCKSGDGGFIQFRPVCYTEPVRSVSSSTNAYMSNLTTNSFPLMSILRDFFDGFPHNELLIQGTYISFGLPGDGFYRQHNYTAWSFTIGYGLPPVENFSLFVIVIISIGLGVPVVLALSGIVYVVVRRCRQRNVPTRFTDDVE